MEDFEPLKGFFFRQEVRHKILVVNNWWAYGRTDYSNLSFEVAPQKKVHWVLWGFLRDSMRTAFFAGVLVGATEVSKKSQAFASRNTGRFRSLDVLYLFVPMTFLRDGSSYDPWKIVKFSCKRQVDGLREKVEFDWWNKSNYLHGFIHARWCRISLNQQYDVNVCYLFALNLFDQVMWRRKKCCFISWDQDVSGERK